jgi:hypothetical protein
MHSVESRQIETVTGVVSPAVPEKDGVGVLICARGGVKEMLGAPGSTRNLTVRLEPVGLPIVLACVATAVKGVAVFTARVTGVEAHAPPLGDADVS